mmetsp:Transcript_733/g.999  ORF Transcript_733/g.999 Transcript_733/m.999 type:complete len:204 (-) Transcript_733:70-681(-)
MMRALRRGSRQWGARSLCSQGETFKKFTGECVPDITSYVETWVRSNPTGEIHIGADSKSAGGIVIFAVAVCLYQKHYGGHVLYKKLKVPFTGSRKSVISCRLLEECNQALEVAGLLEKAVEKPITVHIDCNPDVAHKSSSMYEATTGWITSAGYKARGKPDSWAASSVANCIVNGNFGPQRINEFRRNKPAKIREHHGDKGRQ